MKKTILVIILGLCLTAFVTPQVTNAQVRIGAGVSPNSISYDSLIKDGDTTVINQWTGFIEAQAHPSNNLQVDLSYGYTLGTKINDVEFKSNQSVYSNNGKATIMYNLFSEPNLEIYGGIGFQYSQSNFNYLHEAIQNNEAKLLRLSSGSFIGVTQVNFILADNALISANISGSPWFDWNYRILDTTTHPVGSNWNYIIALELDVNPEVNVSLGYAGGSGLIKQHTRMALTVPEISWSHAGFTASLGFYF